MHTYAQTVCTLPNCMHIVHDFRFGDILRDLLNNFLNSRSPASSLCCGIYSSPPKTLTTRIDLQSLF